MTRINKKFMDEINLSASKLTRTVLPDFVFPTNQEEADEIFDKMNEKGYLLNIYDFIVESIVNTKSLLVLKKEGEIVSGTLVSLITKDGNVDVSTVDLSVEEINVLIKDLEVIKMRIKFKEEDKGKVLATLYNASRPLGMGFLQYDPAIMSEDEALTLLEDQTYFDYLYGRVMKIDLSKTEFDPWLYDRDNGDESAMRALEKACIEIEVIDN